MEASENTWDPCQRLTHGARAAHSDGGSDDTGNPARDRARGVRPDPVSFPFAFPDPSGYRICVQIQREERVRTGAFDAVVR